MSQVQQPSLDGFLVFIRNMMGIPTNYLPDDDPQITYAYDWALDVVSQDLQCAPSVQGAWGPYVRAVYNLGGHTLVEWAVDQSYALSALSWSAGTVSGTTAVTNAILPGDRVQVVDVSPLAYQGPQVGPKSVVVTATPDTTHFQYVLASNPGAATLLTGAAVEETFFAQLRSKLNLGIFAPGVVSNASDVSTSTGLNNPKFMEGLTLENLQLLKTPWGRAYLAIAQRLGPNVWGLS